MGNRRFHRIDVDLKGFLALDSEKIAVQILNLSKGGACLSLTPSDFEKLITLRNLKGSFRLKNEEIPFSCHICWSSESSSALTLGVEFTAMQPSLTKAILNLTHTHEPDFQDGSFHL